MSTQLTKTIIQIFRYLTGTLFIISGLIKLNDPVGTEIKMEEYFGVFAQDIHPAFENLVPAAMAFGVIMCVLEVVLGVALLLQWRMRQTTTTLLGLILFFTFLTFYSAYFNKVTDCGCFGDAIKLTPWQSFSKDIVLTIMIGALFLHRKYLDPSVSENNGRIIVGTSTLLSIGLAWFAINHLPPIDFRKYAVGADIKARVSLPADEYEVMHKMKNLKTGQDELVTTNQYMERWQDTLTWKYIEQAGSKLSKAGDPNRIADFKIYNGDQDYTDSVLNGNWVFLTVTHAAKADKPSFVGLNNLLTEAGKVGIRTAVITADGYDTFEPFRHEMQLAVPVFTADEKVIKTIMRSNPGVWVVSNGKVVGKWHYHDIPTISTVQGLIPKGQ